MAGIATCTTCRWCGVGCVCAQGVQGAGHQSRRHRDQLQAGGAPGQFIAAGALHDGSEFPRAFQCRATRGDIAGDRSLCGQAVIHDGAQIEFVTSEAQLV